MQDKKIEMTGSADTFVGAVTEAAEQVETHQARLFPIDGKG